MDPESAAINNATEAFNIEKLNILQAIQSGINNENVNILEEEDDDDDGDDDDDDDDSGYSSSILEDYTEYDNDNKSILLRQAQEEWEQSLQQLSEALNWVIFPLLGKFLGRRCAHNIWRSFMEYLYSKN
ncbi:Mim2p SCDLUD_001721 [Saccharomycodes ludwigii]|uniref:Mim2p n=1 Tax=Saccharomycodes ludwigii TaxID=36035 RepID=UPI001E8613F3|nr:hypothetical protein SCDLUD_001721 [Saccharomycodes ludwigii]KAH3901936.1 hypothetical protein SCDLUD_001721 [Saccharomycodes ludwigii]